ncbi:MAG TPA: ribonuclease P protein component [Candidatus Paceibacterota bacterium]|nr:ribonuclease P protein component [Candidatus Paceibacterota bacterium]
MYSKQFRLPIEKKKTIGGRSFSTPYFLLKEKDNKEGHNRFGIVIANHAVKSSARRHYWKRSIADELVKFPNLKKDILIIVSPKIESADKKTIQAELQKLIR